MFGFGKKQHETISPAEKVAVLTVHHLEKSYGILGTVWVQTSSGADFEQQYQDGLDRLGQKAKASGADVVIGLIVTPTITGTFLMHGTAIKLNADKKDDKWNENDNLILFSV